MVKKSIWILPLMLFLILAIFVAAQTSNAEYILHSGIMPMTTPSRTRVPVPPEATPVDEDYLPAIFRQEGTPTATLPPHVTPVPSPSRTMVPVP
jgi:hypothetical protein